MNHNEAEDFLAHYGKLGMKWGRRAANPRRGERTATSRAILNARAKYYTEDPVAKAKVKAARTGYKNNKNSDTKAALKSAKLERRILDKETLNRYRETGREAVRDILITTAGAVAVTALAAAVNSTVNN